MDVIKAIGDFILGRRRTTLPFSAYASNFTSLISQYPFPQPRVLIEYFRTCEIIFGCIQWRANAIGGAPIKIYDESGETQEEVTEPEVARFIKRPNPNLSQERFWQIVESDLCISGFSAWEKERTRGGGLLALWPMRPDWCSFLSGDGKPVRAVRYQPDDKGARDLPIEDLLLFQNYDPLYPLLKGLSPLSVCLQTAELDDAAKDMITAFFKQGTVLGGVLSTEQSLTDVEAKSAQERWMSRHTGQDNWWKPAVFGKGLKYQALGLSFKDMDFDALDERTEARICTVFMVPPILIGAKVGLNRSTYSNYEEAKRSFYEDTINPEWRFLAAEYERQMIPEFYEDDLHMAAFDTSKVSAMQEKKDAVWTRADKAYVDGWITRDEARQEVGKDPIDNAPVWAPSRSKVALDLPGDTLEVAKAAERKQFKEYAKKRIKENHPEKIEEFGFKVLTREEQTVLIAQTLPWKDYP